MKYRCAVDVSFDKEDDAVAFLNLIQEIKNRVFKGIGGEEIPIITQCEHHECFHDETPPKQCGNYTNYDLKKAEKDQVKNKKGKKIEAGELLK